MFLRFIGDSIKKAEFPAHACLSTHIVTRQQGKGIDMTHEHDTDLLKTRILEPTRGSQGTSEPGHYRLRRPDGASAEPAGERGTTRRTARGGAGFLANPKENFKEIKKEAKAEFKQSKSIATKIYEKSLEDAKNSYLTSARLSREEYEKAKEQARENFEKALKLAKTDYEFTVDIAKDQYKNGKYPEDLAREAREEPRPDAAASRRARNTVARINYEVIKTGKPTQTIDEVQRMVADIDRDWVEKIAREGEMR